jgi:hypothetical protein
MPPLCRSSGDIKADAPIIDHIGSAHDADELAVLNNAANRIIHDNQLSLDLATTDRRTEIVSLVIEPVLITQCRLPRNEPAISLTQCTVLR